MFSWKKIFLLSVFAVLLSGTNFSMKAMGWEDSGEHADISDWIAADGTYQFPITVADEAWDNLSSVIEMREITHVPDEILQKASTDELIQLILDYPLLSDIKVFDSIKMGYEHLKEEFPAIPELLLREDCYEKLLCTYEEFEIPAERILDYDSLLSEDNYVEDFNALIRNDAYRVQILEDGAVYNRIYVLEMLLLDCMSDNSYSTMDASAFAERYVEKLAEKEVSAYFEGDNETYLLSLLIEEGSPLADEFDFIFIQENMELQTLNVPTITTPSGTVVTNFTYNTNISYDETIYADAILSNNATLISRASTTFNCHSYAWLSSRYKDIYQYICLNSVSEFMSDPYYTKNSTPQIGYIATWTGHSGFITALNRYNEVSQKPDSLMVSKWGQGPIVEHLMTRCPFYISQDVSYYYHQ